MATGLAENASREGMQRDKDTARHGISRILTFAQTEREANIHTVRAKHQVLQEHWLKYQAGYHSLLAIVDQEELTGLQTEADDVEEQLCQAQALLAARMQDKQDDAYSKLQRKRSMAKANVRTINQFAMNEGARAFLPETKRVKSEMLSDYWKQFQQFHYELMETVRAGELQTELNYFQEVEALYEEAQRILQPSAGERKPKSCLQKLHIPTFTGTYTDWLAFKDLFTAAVDRDPHLTPGQKLQYLKTVVTGEAAMWIQAYPTEDSNYQPAWEALTDRYDNKRAIVNTYLQRLTNLPRMTTESARQMRLLAATVNDCLRTLAALEVATESWDVMILHIVEKKFDKDTKRLWELTIPDNDLPSLKMLTSFMQRRIRSLEVEEIEGTVGESSTKPVNKTGQQAQPRQKAQVLNETPWNPKASSFHATATKSCALCALDHTINMCPKFKQMQVVEREDFVRKSRKCLNCLGEGHMVARCASKWKCKICHRPHHTLLHRPRATSESGETPKVDASKPTQHSNPFDRASSSHHAAAESLRQPIKQDGITMLATALVKIKTDSGTFEYRALLDNGSASSFISEAAVQTLKLPKQKANVTIYGLNESLSTTARGIVRFDMCSNNEQFAMNIEALVVPKITGLIPSQKINGANWSHLRGLELADPKFCEPGQIDILLGVGHLNQLLEEGLILGQNGAPMAQRSRLGWILSGATHSSLAAAFEQSSSHHVVSLHACDNSQLEQQMRRFFEQEEIPDEPVRSTEDELCEEHYRNTTKRLPNGRYVVELPFKAETQQLGDSKQVALKRLQQLERRFQLQPQLRVQYNDYIDEFIELKQLTMATDNDVAPQCYFLPHHAVIKESSSTTKLRVVFNASQKTSKGISLNDILHVGPKLQDNLVEILMRFRKHAVAITADIEKMYCQIGVAEPHTNFQRLLWRGAVDQPVREYKLQTLVFGIASSPYQAIRTLKQLADDEAHQYPESCEILKNDFYMDDGLTGCDNVQDAVYLQQELVELLASGGFRLRKWSSNQQAVLDVIPESEREVQTLFELEKKDRNTIKTLGVMWQTSSDQFVFKVNLTPAQTSITKRAILSDVARVYDPLGLLAPCILRAKLFIKDLWIEKFDWDAKLPSEFVKKWLEFRQSLKELEKLQVPRWLGTLSTMEVHYHGFADASEKGYAAAVYVRVVDNGNGFVRCNLVAAKTRVAPQKLITIPRLELSAALLLVKLLKDVKDALKMSATTETAWSDSMVALAWIKNEPAAWQTFVANRVAKIQALFPRTIWNHVRSQDNSADCASRGLNATELMEHELWWHGPAFLREREETWRQQTAGNQVQVSTDLEKRRNVSAFVVVNQEMDELLQRYSSLSTLVGVIAYIQRFYQHGKTPRLLRAESKVLSPAEIQQATMTIVKHVQNQAFAIEIECCRNTENLPDKSKLLAFHPFLDAHGILRVGGRIERSLMNFNRVHQIILPEKSPFTTLLLNRIHQELYHAGAQLMLAVLRREYWIIGARSTIRQIIHRCVSCYRQRGQVNEQLMGALPTPRVNPTEPFARTGVDYFGYVTLRRFRGRGRPQTYKAYGAVFVCMATRAIHMELVTGMTAAAFVAAFCRFVARRGRVSDLYSDCGTTFEGADKQLQVDLRGMLRHYAPIADALSKEGTKWHFIPPAAPHFGGLWEAGVKSAKQHLHRVARNALFTYEELSTLLTGVEACLNSRPLGPMSDDPTDLVPLTPGHFLMTEAATCVPHADFTGAPEHRLDHWQRVQRYLQTVWQRWSEEYLHHLQQRTKWRQRSTDLQVNEMVLVKDERYPPAKWPLGRVVAVQPGRDGRVRVAEVRTEVGLFKRPIVKLCSLPIPLETEAKENEDQQSERTEEAGNHRH